MCTSQWLQFFPNMSIDAYDNTISHHHALILKLISTQNWGPKPFRTINAWFSNPNFKPFVHNEWSKLGERCVSKKLKLLKPSLRVWNKSLFGDIDHRIRNLESQIFSLERIGNEKELNEDEKSKLYSLGEQCRTWRIRKA